MRITTSRTLALCVGALTICGLGAVPVAHAVGSGTFTAITMPTGSKVVTVNPVAGTGPTITVAGTTSADITEVDLDCISQTGSTLETEPLKTAVPVSAGSFSTSVMVTDQPTCTLRAIPTGTVLSLSTYFGSYTGPVVSTPGFATRADTGTVFDYADDVRTAGFSADLTSAGNCGLGGLDHVLQPGSFHEGLEAGCLGGLEALDADSGSATGSSITVDGANAYLPPTIATARLTYDWITAAQVPQTVTHKKLSNGSEVVVESDPVVRCAPTPATFPPTTTSCSSLVSTGVVFRRTTTVNPTAQVVSFEDAYSSADHATHVVTTRYIASVDTEPTGSVGFGFPGHGNALHPAVIGSVTGFGSKAGTLLIRPDLYAAAGDPTVSTYGLTWSRPPTQIDELDTPGRADLDYTFKVAKQGANLIGLNLNSQLRTSDTRKVGAALASDVVSAPKIGTPHNHDTLVGRSTTVKGSVAIGANGLPTTVMVNGHKAKLTASASGVKFAVTFKESLGSHKLDVVARDAYGNTRTTTVKVRNATF